LKLKPYYLSLNLNRKKQMAVPTLFPYFSMN
jgi:hypothetical protein